jgi:sec-independent protein translocase protein TatA
MFGIGALQPMHLILILAIVLVVFGAGKLGQVGGALGQSVREFKNSVSDPEEEARKAEEEARLLAAAKVEPVKAEVAKAVPVAAAARPAEMLRREEI